MLDKVFGFKEMKEDVDYPFEKWVSWKACNQNRSNLHQLVAFGVK